MPEKKLYGLLKSETNPDGFDEFIIQNPDDPSSSFTGEETILINTNDEDGEVVKALKVKWFRGAKGEQGLPGNVVWGNLTVSSIGAALITATTAAAQRLVLGMSAIGSNLVTATTSSAQRSILQLGNAATHNYGTTANTITQGNDLRLIPQYGIIMWFKPVIPEGWAICDGTNGTPNLVDRFIAGCGNKYSLGEVGGTPDGTVIRHNHVGSAQEAGEHNHGSDYPSGSNTNNSGKDTDDDNCASDQGTYRRATTNAGSHTHVLTVADTGVDAADKNLPPYYALYYIMKL